MIRSLALAISLAAAACSGVSSRSSSAPLEPQRSTEDGCAHHDWTPKGEPAQFANVTAPQGFELGEPVMCEHERAYIRVERAEGARRLAVERLPGGAFGAGCTALPEKPDDSAECAELNVLTLLGAAAEELERRGIQRGGPGAGPCAKVAESYDSWNMSVQVYDWKDAEAAVQVVTELMNRYDVRGYVGVGVVGIDCAVLL